MAKLLVNPIRFLSVRYHWGHDPHPNPQSHPSSTVFNRYRRPALPALFLAGRVAGRANVRLWVGDRAQLDPPSVPPFRRTEMGGNYHHDI